MRYAMNSGNFLYLFVEISLGDRWLEASEMSEALLRAVAVGRAAGKTAYGATYRVGAHHSSYLSQG